jgi:Hg(II)-responsive transcriptional regulator
METLSVGQLAKNTRVNIETIRYYERRGLIPPPPRRESGYRQFSKDTIARVRFIKRAQEVGFTLKEISELLSLRVAPDTTCADFKERTLGKISEVEQKIRALQRIKKALVKLKAACRGQGPTSECTILGALDGLKSFK